MSPEQASGTKVDSRTDLWSIGVVLYEILTGVNPFKRESRQATFKAILSDNPNMPSSLNPDIPKELDQILNKALEKDPDLSYQTATDLIADLKRIKREIDSSPSWSQSGSETQKSNGATARRPFLLFTFAFLLLALLGTGAFFWFEYVSNQPEPSPWLNATATKLTDFAGAESYPSISPDGKVLIYSRLVNGKNNIFYQRIGGSNPQNLTTDANADDWQPAFSPDGEQIAFRSNRSGGGLFLMGATGESIKQLTNLGYNPAWSPDGKEIVFSTMRFLDPMSRGNDGEIWAVNISNGEKRQIKTGIDSLQPQFSPNGKRLAFWGKDEQFQRDLWTSSADGNDIVRITNDAEPDWNPVWSPDGRYLYFCSIRNGGASLWRLSIDQKSGKPLSEPEAVVAPLAQSWLLTISRDGKSLVYVREQRIGNIQQIEFDAVKMQTIGKPRPITEGSKSTRTADVSPDGKQVVFYLSGETQEDLVTVKTDSLKWNQITQDEARDRAPRFSPDGSRIAFYSNLTGVHQIWTIKPDGSDRQQLTNDDGRGFCYPVWSPDGKRIAFSGIGTGAKVIETGKTWAQQTPIELPPLNEEGDWFVAWSWSPDGMKLAGWRYNPRIFENSDIYVYSFETKSYEKLRDYGLQPVWLADNRNLIISQNDKLIILDTLTKAEHEILSMLPQQIDSPAITPDNRFIYYGLITVESDIQMLSIK
jgi:Tol biopolymer transport system component